MKLSTRDRERESIVQSVILVEARKKSSKTCLETDEVTKL